MDALSKLHSTLSSNIPIIPPSNQIDLSVSYAPWIELEAISLTAEYCATYSITDSLAVRYVHYVALGIVLEGDQ